MIWLGLLLACLGVAVFVYFTYRKVNPCGGLIVGGTCTKRFGHRGRCR